MSVHLELNPMNRWQIAMIMIAALLLVGAVGAVKPVKEPVDKIVLIHYKDGAARTAPSADPGATFKLMGVRWNSQSWPVTYYLDTTGIRLNSGAVRAEFAKAFDEWGRNSGPVSFVDGGSSSAVAANGINDVSFTWLSDTNVIAVTTVWYYTTTKEIVEADIQMNTRMPWGIDADGEGSGSISPKGAYDIRNIATHEIGHVCGLADLYTTRSREQTMYGYGGIGEVKKDSLESGDKAGLVKLYGT